MAAAFDAVAACSPNDQATADQHYNTAYQFASAQQWADAIAPLEVATTLCPEHWTALELLAQARLQLQQNAESARDYRRLIDGQHGGELTGADIERVLKPYGFALLHSAAWEEATELYLTLLSLDPQSEEARERLVYIHVNGGDFARAAIYLEQLYEIVEDGAERADVATRLGNAYANLGKSETAKTWLEIGAGGGGGAMFQLGLEQMKRGAYQEAVAAFADFLKINPDNVPARKNLGQCYERLGRAALGARFKPDAIAAYETVVAAEPQRHDVQSSLGFLYLEVEEFGKAADLAAQAIAEWPALDAQKGGMFYLMGKVREERDADYEGAIQMFEFAREDPYWGAHAEAEIERQLQLIRLRESKQTQGKG